MYSSPMRTNFGSTLFPGGFVGSNANRRPETWGNLPSSLGYCETPFSRASIICAPDVPIEFRYVYSVNN